MPLPAILAALAAGGLLGVGAGAVARDDIDLIPGVGPNEVNRFGTKQYNDANKNKESYRNNGVIYNYGGDPIGTYTQDPKPTGHTPDATTVVEGGGGVGVGGSVGSIYNPQQAALYDQSIAQLNAAKDRLGTQLGIAQGNINRQYSTNQNELQSAYDRAQNAHRQSTTANSQSLRTNYNNANDKASAGLQGLARLLGAHGAGGSSSMLMAGDAVQKTATADRTGANQTFAENQRSLDTNWGNFGLEHENSKKKLEGWKSQQLQQAEQQAKSSEQSLLTQLAQLQAQRASVLGGNVAAAGQPYLDQANALSSRIDQLGAINPTYDGRTPVYQQAALDSYRVADNSRINTQSLPGVQNSTIYNTLLNREDEEKRY